MKSHFTVIFARARVSRLTTTDQQTTHVSVVNGGYSASCVLAAANAYLSRKGHWDTLTAHFEYLQRTAPGPGVVVIEEVKLGQQLSRLHATLWQGRLLDHAPWIDMATAQRTVVAYTNHTNLRTFDGISMPTSFESTPAAALPPRPDFASLKQAGSDHIWEEALVPEAFKPAGFLEGWRHFMPSRGPLSPGILDMWMCMVDEEKITQRALPYVVDSFPIKFTSFVADPRVEEARLRDMWHPTILMNLEVKSMLPKEGIEWVYMRAMTKQMNKGRLDIDLQLRSADGQLLALSNQVALMVPWEKNTKGAKATL